MTGIRQDAYANYARLPVEQDKPASAQGTYLSPQAYGQPLNMGEMFTSSMSSNSTSVHNRSLAPNSTFTMSLRRRTEMTKRTSWIILGVIALLMVGVALVSAAPLAGYAIDWWTVDGGGGSSSSGAYSLSGTIGQPDTGQLSGGGYSLSGGFWEGSVASF